MKCLHLIPILFFGLLVSTAMSAEPQASPHLSPSTHTRTIASPADSWTTVAGAGVTAGTGASFYEFRVSLDVFFPGSSTPDETTTKGKTVSSGQTDAILLDAIHGDYDEVGGYEFEIWVESRAAGSSTWVLLSILNHRVTVNEGGSGGGGKLSNLVAYTFKWDKTEGD